MEGAVKADDLVIRVQRGILRQHRAVQYLGGDFRVGVAGGELDALAGLLQHLAVRQLLGELVDVDLPARIFVRPLPGLFLPRKDEIQAPTAETPRAATRNDPNSDEIVTGRRQRAEKHEVVGEGGRDGSKENDVAGFNLIRLYTRATNPTGHTRTFTAHSLAETSRG